MATDLTGLTVSLDVNLAIQAKKAIDLSTPQENLVVSQNIALTFGAAADMADQSCSDRRVLTDSQVEQLDLVGSLLNAFGVAVSFARIKMIIIKNTSDLVTTGHVAATTAGIKIEPGTAPPASCPTIPILPVGGIFVLACDVDDGNWGLLAGGTADQLKITNLSTDEAQYDIVIVGESL